MFVVVRAMAPVVLRRTERNGHSHCVAVGATLRCRLTSRVHKRIAKFKGRALRFSVHAAVQVYRHDGVQFMRFTGVVS